MKKRIIGGIAAAGLLLTACETGTGKRNNEQKKDRQIANEVLAKYQEVQPAPVYDFSQLRQNLIEIEETQAHATATRTFFFNQGATDPLFVCPSIGLPIDSTAQITNPEQKLEHDNAVVPQIEPNGVYSGESTGTYVICVNPQGAAYGVYWEGFVLGLTHEAEWDFTAHTMKLEGGPTAEFSGTE